MAKEARNIKRQIYKCYSRLHEFLREGNQNKSTKARHKIQPTHDLADFPTSNKLSFMPARHCQEISQIG